jgi:hypothetical protein
VKPIVYNRPYCLMSTLMCRIGNAVPIWQPFIGSPLQKCIRSAPPGECGVQGKLFFGMAVSKLFHLDFCLCVLSCPGYGVQALTQGTGALGSLAKFAESFE